MKKILAVVLSSVLLSGCASEVLNKQTASGKPEGVYPNHTVEQVMEALVQNCNEKGFAIEEQAKNYVVCSREMQGGSAILTQLAIGNAYSTNPVQKVRYSASKFGTGSKVWAEAWSETQMALGQVNKVANNDNKTKNNIQTVLDETIPKILAR